MLRITFAFAMQFCGSIKPQPSETRSFPDASLSPFDALLVLCKGDGPRLMQTPCWIRTYRSRLLQALAVDSEI